MKAPKTIFSLLLCLLLNIGVFAQCPSSVTINSTDVSAASCPSSGSVIVHSNIEGQSGAQYQIIAGPQTGGWQNTVQSSNTFTSLPTGDYTIKVTCNGGVSNTVNVTVPNNYTAPAFTTTVESCVGGGSVGNITVNVSAGSSTPLLFGIYKGTDANAPDASYNYGNSNIFNSLAFGIYQVRVKDQCGVFVTQTVSIQPKYKKAALDTWGYNYSNTCGKAIVNYNLRDAVNNNGLAMDASSYKLEIWESNTTTCPGTSGTPTVTMNVNESSPDNFQINTSTKSYTYRITSPCGEVYTDCINYDLTFKASPVVAVPCGAGNYAINFSTNGVTDYSLHIIGYAANGTKISDQTYPNQSSTIFSNLTPADHYSYTFTAGSGCNTISGNVATPKPADGVVIDAVYQEAWCTTQVGTSVVSINFGGYIPGLASMTKDNIKLINKYDQTKYYSPSVLTANPLEVVFANVLPGTYILQFTAPTGGCVASKEIDLTSGTTFKYSLNTVVTQQCGAANNAGSIAASLNTNGSATASFILYDANNHEIANNSSGNFTNLAAGTYTVTAKMYSDCYDGQMPAMASKTVIISDPAGGPQLLKKIGITCDNGTSGIVGLSIAGSGPFTIEYRKSSDNTFTTLTNNAGTEYSYSNLTPNESYDFRVTDGCGKSNTTKVTIQPLAAINKATTMNPCAGQPYTLAVEEYPGATYSWTFNGASTPYTTAAINFNPYTTNYDGTWVATVSYSGCVSRSTTFKLNSAYCGSPLPVTFGTIDAKLSGNNLVVNWNTLNETNNRMFEIEVSADGTNFKRVGTVDSKAKDGNSTAPLSYTFEMPISQAAKVLAGSIIFGLALFLSFKRKISKMAMVAVIIIAGSLVGISCKRADQALSKNAEGTSYIRIAIVDFDGNKAYSKAQKIIQD